ncbi:hypothetical protein CSC33_1307 [Pseudomonas aeruginosa]|nr:hypothetical protein CSC33_1307 [Pseudomonas aeruginosa]
MINVERQCGFDGINGLAERVLDGVSVAVQLWKVSTENGNARSAVVLLETDCEVVHGVPSG